MELKELLGMQRELDQHIVDNAFNIIGDEIPKVDGSDKSFLIERLLALQVEVSEFANKTRCFKYWSKKKAEPKEELLDEFVDILHFWLSVANVMKFTAEEIEQAYLKKNKENYKRQEEGY